MIITLHRTENGEEAEKEGRNVQQVLAYFSYSFSPFYFIFSFYNFQLWWVHHLVIPATDITVAFILNNLNKYCDRRRISRGSLHQHPLWIFHLSGRSPLLFRFSFYHRKDYGFIWNWWLYETCIYLFYTYLRLVLFI